MIDESTNMIDKAGGFIGRQAIIKSSSRDDT